MKLFLLAILAFAFCSCASNTIYQRGTVTSKTGQRSNAAIKAYQQYGDIIGDQTITCAKNGTVTITVTTPHGTDIPVKRVAVLNKDRTAILGYNEYPCIAASLPSEGTRALFTGITTSLRAVGSLTGTVFSGIVGIAAANASSAPASAATTR
ncbi:MAG: hypothetical protein ABI615_11280 [Chthoniobacterales bacterium]